MKLKKVQKKKFKKKEKTSGFVKYNHEIIGILVLALGTLMTLSVYYTKSVGLFGSIVKDMLTGLIGMPSFLLPPILVVYAFFIIFKKNNADINLRCIYTIILVLLISSMIQTAYYNPKEFENLTPGDSLILFYENGKSLIGGGVLGGLVSTPFLIVFQATGTIIILCTLSIIDIILLTNMSIANFIRNTKSIFVGLFRKLAILFNNIKEFTSEKETETASDEPEIKGFGDESSLKLKTEKKVIDFKLEKESKELKQRTKETKELVQNGESGEIEPVELVISDLRNKKPADAKKDKESKPDTNIENQIQQSLNEIHSFEYRYPPLELLNENTEGVRDVKSLRSAAIEGAKKLEDTLKSFGVEAKVINISRGPAVTRYELQPGIGVKVNKIVSLSDDISLNLASSGVRIEAPIPGKAAIGIEVPNKEITPVFLREVIESPEFSNFSSKLAFAVGKDISGENIVADIAKMPHLLIAGATGAGKSVCINSLIVSILYKATPDEVKLLMIDPKVVELGVYNGIPHLLIPVVTDPKKAAGALNWAVQEMVNRYKLFADKGVRDIKGYNNALKESGEEGLLPQIVIIIDELADLMMVAPNDVEDAICRLAQMARAAGMHLVIATQRPSVDVITGIIKANIPSRISFAVSSQIDSRTILDMAGAEKLLGKGDMLFYPVGEPKPIRVKGAFISDREIENIVEYVKSQASTEYDANIIEEINSEKETEESQPGDNDELLPQAIDLVVDTGQASVSLIQRKFKVGYARAARIIDQMEARGIIGGYEGSKPRQVLISRQQWQELKMQSGH